MSKLPEHEGGVTDAASNLQILKRKYENFEKTLFEKKFSETRYIIKDTTQLIEKIQTQQDKLSKTAANARDDVEQVTPHSQDQRAKLRKLMADIAAVERKVENSVKVIE